jgi:MYXO-CTERM domain-containing protein
MGRLARIASLVALSGVVGGVGCFNNTTDTTEAASTTSHVNAQGDTSAVLKSTLLLESGCAATKIGPSVLLTAARCVVGSSKLIAGSTVKFTVAGTGAAAAQADAGPRANSTLQSFVVADVKVHPSFGAKCSGEACAIGKDASDAADVAVILLDADLETVPAVPIDLDTVGEADPLLVVASGCSALDADDGASTRTNKTIAIPAAAAAHQGSAYTGAASASTTRLAQSYVVTAGVGWQNNGLKVCRRDVGAPVFRGGSAAVAGVTSTITTVDTTLAPVTIEHTRVDALSRFKIADWLVSFGAQTIHSCSESAGGCQKHEYDGGLPPADSHPPADTTGPDDDAGTADASAPAEDAGDRAAPRTEPVSQDPAPSADDYGDEDYGDAAVPSKKSKKATAGCSAAPGEMPAGSDVGLGLAVALGAVLVRRRRAA